jgi:hypothetical protein
MPSRASDARGRISPRSVLSSFPSQRAISSLVSEFELQALLSGGPCTDWITSRRQLVNVRSWHLADLQTSCADVCSSGSSGLYADMPPLLGLTHCDKGVPATAVTRYGSQWSILNRLVFGMGSTFLPSGRSSGRSLATALEWHAYSGMMVRSINS